MKPWMKWVLGIVVCLVVLIILTLVLVTSFINPNDYKSRIETTFHEKTGLYLNIGKKIKWSLFPSIGLNVKNINIEDPKKRPLATLQEAQVSLKLIPLFFKNIEMKTAIINGVQLNIVKMTNGRFNWQQSPTSHAVTKITPPVQEHQPQAPEKTASIPSAKARNNTPISLNIKQIEFKKIDLHYYNQLTHQDIYIKNAYMNAGNILSGKHFPVSAGFTINSKNPTLGMNVTLKGNGLIDQKKHTYALKDIDLKATPLQPEAKGDHFTLKGNASVHGTAVTFDLNGSPLHLKNYLPITSKNKKEKTVSEQPQSEHAKSKKTSTPVEAANKVIIPTGIIQPLNIDGKLELASLTFNNLTFNHPELMIKADKGIAQISRLKAGFYNGIIDAKATVNTQYSMPNVSINASIKGTDLQKLGQALQNIKNIQGNVNATVRLLTQGTTQDLLTKNLNGEVSFHIDHGQMTGININHLVCRMIAGIRNKKIEKKEWGDTTQFTALKGEWHIRDGIAYNNDLSASLNQMDLKGDGWVNLVKKNMDYHMGLTITGSSAEPSESACEINHKYADITWPVQCKGKIGEKHLCGIDTERLGDMTKVILQREAKDALQKQLKKHFGKDIGNKIQGFFK